MIYNIYFSIRLIVELLLGRGGCSYFSGDPAGEWAHFGFLGKLIWQQEDDDVKNDYFLLLLELVHGACLVIEFEITKCGCGVICWLSSSLLSINLSEVRSKSKSACHREKTFFCVMLSETKKDLAKKYRVKIEKKHDNVLFLQL